MKDDKYVVYKHCSPSGKVYVGITSQLPDARWKRGKGYENNPYFSKAIKKYGWDSFTHEILYSNLTEDEACEIEKRLIRELKTFDREFGYNIAMGGSATSPTEETREKISASVANAWNDDQRRASIVKGMIGKKRSESARKNISIAQSKRFENPDERKAVSDRQKGKTRTESAKEKTSNSLRIFYQNKENAEKHKADMAERNKRLRKKVICKETQTVFDSITMAAEFFGMSHQNLSACLNGKRNTFAGFHWEWV